MISRDSVPPRGPVGPSRAPLRIVASTDKISPASAAKRCEHLFTILKARLRTSMGQDPQSRTDLGDPSVASTSREQLGELAVLIDEIRALLPTDAYTFRGWDGERQLLHRILGRALQELATSQLNEKHARHLATHDVLTALPNRSHFQERLNGYLQPHNGAPRYVAVLYIDLDDFKSLNDTHGHRAGDEFLRIAAARMAHTVRARDMVCRMGGDEFACFLTDMPDRRHVGGIAAKIFDAVSAPLRLGEIVITTRPSIGIAVAPTDGTTVDTLLHNADTAMYHAKRHGGPYTFFVDIN